MPLAGTLGFQICTSSKAERDTFAKHKSRAAGIQGACWGEHTALGIPLLTRVRKAQRDQVPVSRLSPTWSVLGTITGAWRPETQRNAAQTKQPLGCPCLRTGAFTPKCLPPSCTVCGTNSKLAGSNWTSVASLHGRPPRSMPPFVTDTCVGRTLSASHSFQVSSNPRTV